MREEELTAPLIEHFRERGCRVATEVPIGGKTCDVYAIQPDGKTIAVEVKVQDWRRALWQAVCYGFGADFAYVALPLKVARRMAAIRKKQEKETRARWPEAPGLAMGILGIAETGKVTELVPAQQSKLVRVVYIETALMNLELQEENGLLPTKRFPPSAGRAKRNLKGVPRAC